MQNLNAEAVEYIYKNHRRIAVEKIEPSFAKDLKLKYPDDARAVIDYQAINHILKEHKNLSFEDIANYRELSKQANETLKLKDNQNRPVVASFNQINGFFVVVEQVSNAKNELNTNKTASLEAITEAKTNANNEISTNKTQAITNINETKESANNEISTNKTQAITNITQEKQQATSEIAEAKKTAFNELLETLKPKFSGLFAGAYYIHNVIYVNGGWEQKVKDLSDYTLEKSKKGE
ncbi:hypothetical protein BD0078_11970 [Helicobacter pylori]|uniref:PBECR3 domain-containing polyvalent protein n=1 Tax=Helicobacter pylori TaxID=210 RepID=UPI0036F3A24F